VGHGSPRRYPRASLRLQPALKLVRAQMEADRVLHDGEKITWEGIPLQFFYLPGPDRVCGGLVNRDRPREIAVDGDNVFNTWEADFSSPTLTAAITRGSAAVISILPRNMLELRPDYICPNHTEWIRTTPETLRDYPREAEQVQDTCKQIIDQPARNWS
jgi:hypothetical protein